MRDVLNPKSFFTLKRKMSHEICDSTSWSVNKNQRIGESRIHKTRAILNYNIQIIVPNNLFPLPKQSIRKLQIYESFIYLFIVFNFFIFIWLKILSHICILTRLLIRFNLDGEKGKVSNRISIPSERDSFRNVQIITVTKNSPQWSHKTNLKISLYETTP